MELEFDHDTDAKRYVVRKDGEMVSALDYALSPTAVSFTHTFTPPPHRGHGYAADLVAFAVDDVEKNTSLSIRPSCWYVGQWFDRHPERSGLLNR